MLNANKCKDADRSVEFSNLQLGNNLYSRAHDSSSRITTPKSQKRSPPHCAGLNDLHLAVCQEIDRCQRTARGLPHSITTEILTVDKYYITFWQTCKQIFKVYLQYLGGTDSVGLIPSPSIWIKSSAPSLRHSDHPLSMLT